MVCAAFFYTFLCIFMHGATHGLRSIFLYIFMHFLCMGPRMVCAAFFIHFYAYFMHGATHGLRSKGRVYCSREATARTGQRAWAVIHTCTAVDRQHNTRGVPPL